MTLTDTEEYHLARFLSYKYDISLERATKFVIDPETEDWREYEFVDAPRRFDYCDYEGYFSEEFLDREDQLRTLTKAYCEKSPLYVESYLTLLDVTDEKQTELKFDNTNNWYESDQVEEIVSELWENLDWLQNTIYEEPNVPDPIAHVYDLNLSFMLYGLDNSERRISVDYKNGYRTLRSTPHTDGYISEDRYSTYANSMGMRLASSFTEGRDNDIEDIDNLSDIVVEELSPYYEGPVRKLVKVVEDSLNLHSQKEF